MEEEASRASAPSALEENLCRDSDYDSLNGIGLTRPGQHHRDDPQLPLTLGHLPRDRRTHLLVVPGPEGVLTNDHRARIAAHQRLLDLRLPGLAGDEVPRVEPGGDPRIEQPTGQILDDRLVDRAVREEDIVV